MYPGQCTLCLKTTDLTAMRNFYQALGMKVHSERPQSVLLNNGDLDLALMTFLPAHCLNFRGSDIDSLHDIASASGHSFDTQPHRYSKEFVAADADGISWMMMDPDSNNIFFDTNDNETGEKGKSLALQRVLDATAKQLINVGATRACQDDFKAHLLDQFLPPDQRVATEVLDTAPLTEPGSFAGFFSYCLKTTDTVAARDFYQSIGLSVSGNNDENWVSMGTPDFHIDLMSFLGENWLNFRGADVFELYRRLHANGFELVGEPSTYSEEETGVRGMHWQTKDPDGNVVYFDTTDPEQITTGAPKLLQRVLDTALAQLTAIEADRACIDAFEAEIVEKFSG